MNIAKPCCAALAALTPAIGFGFFDDFDGDALGPHWGTVSEGCYLNYDVGGGMLNITGIYAPGSPGALCEAGLSTTFAATRDFRMTARLSWDAGEYQDFFVLLGTGDPAWYADVGLIGFRKRPGEEAQVIGGFGGVTPYGIVAAPGVGVLHEFKMERIGFEAKAWLNGSLIYSRTLSDTPDARVLMLWVVGPDDARFAPLHADSVEMTAVPEPASIFSLCTLLAVFFVSRMTNRRALFRLSCHPPLYDDRPSVTVLTHLVLHFDGLE